MNVWSSISSLFAGNKRKCPEQAQSPLEPVVHRQDEVHQQRDRTRQKLTAVPPTDPNEPSLHNSAPATAASGQHNLKLPSDPAAEQSSLGIGNSSFQWQSLEQNSKEDGQNPQMQRQLSPQAQPGPAASPPQTALKHQVPEEITALEGQPTCMNLEYESALTIKSDEQSAEHTSPATAYREIHDNFHCQEVHDVVPSEEEFCRQTTEFYRNYANTHKWPARSTTE